MFAFICIYRKILKKPTKDTKQFFLSAFICMIYKYAIIFLFKILFYFILQKYHIHFIQYFIYIYFIIV